MNFFIVRMRYVYITAAIIAGAAFVLFSGHSIIQTFHSNGRELPIYSVERNDNKIALTFDCAWNDDDIDSILNTLDKYNAKATFFILGQWAEKYPESVKKIYDHGHEIGGHSYSHTDYTTLSVSDMEQDMTKTDSAIENTGAEVSLLFRAPSGAYNDTVVSAVEGSGRIYVQWSKDSIDYTDDATKASIIKRSTENVIPGDIILLHNGTKYTAQALDEILSILTQNFQPVILSDLIYFNQFRIDNTGKQIPLQ